MITLYSKPNCPHCVLAKQFLDEHGVPYRVIDVMANPDALRFIKEERGHKTVPQLYVGERLLVEGGNSGLRTLGIDGLRTRLKEGQGA